MRKAIIVLVGIAVLVLVHFALRSTFQDTGPAGGTPSTQGTPPAEGTQPVTGAQPAVKTGGLTGAVRERFVSAAIQSCASKFPAGYQPGAVQTYCACASNDAADLIGDDDLVAMKQSGQIPDDLAAKLQDPIKQCLKDAKLAPQ